MKRYDLIIIGAGPAGLTAAVYSARYKLKTLVIGKIIGGDAVRAYKIENFPSYKSIKGYEFAKRLKKQVEKLGMEIKLEKVEEVKKNKIFEVKTKENKYFCKKMIIATGVREEKLNLKNEYKFLGHGLSYCVSCDAAFFKDKITAVVGGSNAALTSALLLAEFSKNVYIIYRRDRFYRADPIWIEKIKKNKKIKVKFNSNVVELIGKDKLEEVKLDNSKKIRLDGLFIEIGGKPSLEFAKDLKLKLEKGYIKVNKEQKTNVKGVYAAGDITTTSLKQIIVACAGGAIAATNIYNELKEE